MKSTLRQQTVPLRQGAKRVFRRMTKCHSVPSEGSTTQCDAGPEGSEAEGVDENALERGLSKSKHSIHPLPLRVLPLSQGEKVEDNVSQIVTDCPPETGGESGW